MKLNWTDTNYGLEKVCCPHRIGFQIIVGGIVFFTKGQILWPDSWLNQAKPKALYMDAKVSYISLFPLLSKTLSSMQPNSYLCHFPLKLSKIVSGFAKQDSAWMCARACKSFFFFSKWSCHEYMDDAQLTPGSFSFEGETAMPLLHPDLDTRRLIFASHNTGKNRGRTSKGILSHFKYLLQKVIFELGCLPLKTLTLCEPRYKSAEVWNRSDWETSPFIVFYTRLSAASDPLCLSFCVAFLENLKP